MWKLVSGKNHKVFFVVNEITIFKETKDWVVVLVIVKISYRIAYINTVLNFI
jgi:hypothetical protein